MWKVAVILTTVVLGFSNTGTAKAHVRSNHRKQRGHIVERAYDRLGASYCWGGTSGCYDCSGFTYRVFLDHGASLPHSSSRQWDARHRSGWRTHWKRKNLKRGDLLFFSNTYKRGISHIGIYLGKGRFIHSSSSGGVRRDSLHEDYYRSRFKAGVRPVALRS